MFKRKNFLVDNNPDDSDSNSSDGSVSGDDQGPRYDADGYRIMPSEDDSGDSDEASDEAEGSDDSAEEDSEGEGPPTARGRPRSAAPAKGGANGAVPEKPGRSKPSVWAELADEAVRGDFDGSSSGGDDDSGDEELAPPPVEELFGKAKPGAVAGRPGTEEGGAGEGEDGGMLKGRALRCMVCPDVLLLNEASLRDHVASKRHLRAVKRREPGWDDPIVPAHDLEASDSDSDDLDDDMMETHAERLARIRRMEAMDESGADPRATAAEPAGKLTRKERKKKMGRQRQRVRKLIKEGKLPPGTKPLKNRKERRAAAAAAAAAEAAAAAGGEGAVSAGAREGKAKAKGDRPAARPGSAGGAGAARGGEAKGKAKGKGDKPAARPGTARPARKVARR